METFKFQFPVSALNQLIDQSNHKNSRNESYLMRLTRALICVNQFHVLISVVE